MSKLFVTAEGDIKEMDKIEVYSQAAEKYEDLFIKKLNFCLEAGMYCKPYVSEMGKYARSVDAVIYTTDRKKEIELLKIELESGVEQNDWDDLLPSSRRWPRGLSLSSRKHYHNSDIFIKYSKTTNCAILISTPWLLSQISEQVATKSKHSMSMKTNSHFYSIPHVSLTLGQESGSVLIIEKDEYYTEEIQAFLSRLIKEKG